LTYEVPAYRQLICRKIVGVAWTGWWRGTSGVIWQISVFFMNEKEGWIAVWDELSIEAK